MNLDAENIVCEGAPHSGGLDALHDTARVVDNRSELRQSRPKIGQKSAMGRLGGTSVIGDGMLQTRGSIGRPPSPSSDWL